MAFHIPLYIVTGFLGSGKTTDASLRSRALSLWEGATQHQSISPLR